MSSRLRRSVVVAQATAACFEPLEPRRLMSAFAVPTDLDPSFSGDGKVITDFGGADDIAQAVAVQPDGKIVVAGQTQVTVNGKKLTAFAAARYNRDGSLDDGSATDTSKGDKFANAGKFTRVLDLGGGTGAVAIAIQKDGKIVLAGNSTKSVAGENPLQWYFLRLNKDGSTDGGFGTNGVESTDFIAGINPKLNAILLEPNGRLVAAGSVEGDWMLLGLTPKGQPDPNFGVSLSGLSSIDFGGVDTAVALGLDNLGNIIVAGNGGGNGVKQSVGVARFSSDGVIDGSFGTQGRGVVEPLGITSSNVGALAVLPSGDIQVAYASVDVDNNRFGGSVMFDQQGNFLGGGSNSGKIGTDGLANTPSDFLVEGGTNIERGPERFYVAEVHGGMEVDTTFGSNSDHNVASALVTAPDGSVIQVGYTTAGGGGRNFAIARYIGTPVKDLALITGNVFADNDSDGVKDSDEAGIPNARVFIDFDNNGVFEHGFITERSVLTDANGNYRMYINPFKQHIREVLPPLKSQTLPLASLGLYDLVAPANKTTGGIDFGNASPGVHVVQTRITGSVFFDFDGDGTRDVQHPTEPDLAGRTVFLDLNSNGVLDNNEPSTVTSAGGNYAFNGIAPGTYRVRDILPSGWTHTNPSSGFIDVTVPEFATAVARFGTTFDDPDDTISKVNHRSGNQIAVGGSVNFTIANVTDVDLVRFTVTAGQRVGFDEDRATGSSLNALLRLFDATGKQLANNDDAPAPGEGKGPDSYLAFTFKTAGTYYIAVSNNTNRSYNPITGAGDNGSGSTGMYKLSLVNLPAVTATTAANFVGQIEPSQIDPSLTGPRKLDIGNDSETLAMRQAVV